MSGFHYTEFYKTGSILLNEEEKDKLFGYIADLKAENARLRSCLSDDADNARQIMGENAKLRELVHELYECSRQIGCDKCGYKDGCAMFDRMAQLGVEV